MEILKQPNNKPNIIELQIILVAFGTLGVLDNLAVNEVKKVISLASYIVNVLFRISELKILIFIFRYLNEQQLKDVTLSLLKYVFLKMNNINLKEIN